MCDWFLPRDVVYMIFRYAAYESTPRIALTCRAVRQLTLTQDYWRPTAKHKLFQVLGHLLDASRLALVNVFAGLPSARALTSEQARERLAWMYWKPGMPRAYVLQKDVGRYNYFSITNQGGTIAVLRFYWHYEDKTDVAIEYLDGDEWVGDLLLHPTVRKKRITSTGRVYYEVEDPARKRLWIGPGIYRYDSRAKRGTIVPDESMGFHKLTSDGTRVFVSDGKWVPLNKMSE
jgi:hypothetical protein